MTLLQTANGKLIIDDRSAPKPVVLYLSFGIHLILALPVVAARKKEVTLMLVLGR